MSKEVAEVLTSILNFLGGGILCFDTLRIKRNLQEKAGAQKIVDAFRALKVENPISDDTGKALTSTESIDQWLASRSLRLGWLAFGLMTLGFLLEVVCKLLH